MKKYLMLALSLSMAACSQHSPSATISTDNYSMAEANRESSASINQEQLQAYSWQLVSATDAKNQKIEALFKAPEANKPITLNFGQNDIKIKNLFCNLSHLNIDFEGNQFTVKQPIITTMKGCPADIEHMERTLVKLLSSKPTLTIGGDKQQPVLTLLSSKQEKLVFKGIATPESKYGTQATTIFLEIAPETKPCNAGSRHMQCLKVREIKYNEQGIKTSTPAQWQNFYDAIEGYEHDPSQRVILRVKKYAVNNPPADASSSAYVLDMVVEQENVKNK